MSIFLINLVLIDTSIELCYYDDDNCKNIDNDYDQLSTYGCRSITDITKCISIYLFSSDKGGINSISINNSLGNNEILNVNLFNDPNCLERVYSSAIFMLNKCYKIQGNRFKFMSDDKYLRYK